MGVRLCAWLAISVQCLGWISPVHADEVRTPAPTEPAQAPTSVSEPVQVTPAPEAPTGLVIHEIPPPPPNYGAPAAPAPTATPPGATAPNVPPPPSVFLVPPAPSLAPVDDPTKHPGYRTHDGFFFRGSLGVANTLMFEEQEGLQLDVGGLGVPITLAVGGTIYPSLVLYGEIHAASVVVSSATVGGEERDVSRASISSLSVGASYYVMPHNLYFAGALGFGGANVSLHEDSEQPEGHTGTGLALRVSIGKEWWAGGEWGICAAAHVLFMSLPDGDNNSLSVISIGASATATYN